MGPEQRKDLEAVSCSLCLCAGEPPAVDRRCQPPPMLTPHWHLPCLPQPPPSRRLWRRRSTRRMRSMHSTTSQTEGTDMSRCPAAWCAPRARPAATVSSASWRLPQHAALGCQLPRAAHSSCGQPRACRHCPAWHATPPCSLQREAHRRERARERSVGPHGRGSRDDLRGSSLERASSARPASVAEQLPGTGEGEGEELWDEHK